MMLGRQKKKATLPMCLAAGWMVLPFTEIGNTEEDDILKEEVTLFVNMLHLR